MVQVGSNTGEESTGGTEVSVSGRCAVSATKQL